MADIAMGVYLDCLIAAMQIETIVCPCWVSLQTLQNEEQGDTVKVRTKNNSEPTTVPCLATPKSKSRQVGLMFLEGW
jgi:hypothetical protein